MIDELGDTYFRKLMKVLCSLQAQLVEEDYMLPLTGNFIQNRGSMINWCPIGRNASPNEREQFKALDKLYRIRQKYSLSIELIDLHILEELQYRR